MGKNDQQINRQLYIEQMNAESRALEAQLKQEAQESSGGGYYRPTGISKYGQLAQDTGMLKSDFGTDVGGQAYYHAVDFGSPDAMTGLNTQGGPDSVDAPTGPITPELLAYEKELQQGLEGYTNVYYENVAKLNEMSALAASQGMNIKQPDPLDENQRNISNYYNQLYKETMHLADQLKQGHDAEKMRAEKGYRALTHAGSAIGVPTRFEDLAQDKLPSVERFNASIKTGGYTDYSAYKSELARYNAMRDNLEEQRDQYQDAGQLDQVDRYNEFIEALQRPTYDGSVDKRMKLEREKMKNDQERWKAENDLKWSKKKSTEDIIYAVANAFKNKTSYRYDSSTGEIYNDSFTGLKWAGGTIDNIIMTNPSNLTQSEIDEYRTLLDKQNRNIKAKEKYTEYVSKNPNATDAQKQQKKEEYINLFGLGSMGLSDSERKRIAQLEKVGANSMGDLVVRYTKTNTKGEGTTTDQKVSSARDFMRGLSTHNSKTVDDETISLIGMKKGWLLDSGDWDWDAVIGTDYEAANKSFDAVIRAKEGDYGNLYQGIADYATNNSEFDRDFSSWFGDIIKTDYDERGGGHILDTRGTKLESLGKMKIFPSDEDGKYDIIFGEGMDEKSVAKNSDLKTIFGRDILKEVNPELTNTRDFTHSDILKFLDVINYAKESPTIQQRLSQINDINDYNNLKARSAKNNTYVSNEETMTSKNSSSGQGNKKKVAGF
jgi:hypothetical protein